MKSNYHARDKANNTSIYVETNGQTVISISIYSDDGCHTIAIPPQRVMHEPGVGIIHPPEDMVDDPGSGIPEDWVAHKCMPADKFTSLLKSVANEAYTQGFQEARLTTRSDKSWRKQAIKQIIKRHTK